MSVTVTIPLVPIFVYLAIGAVLWLPLEWWQYRRFASQVPEGFWSQLLKGLRKRPWVPLLVTVVWPYAAWEAAR